MFRTALRTLLVHRSRLLTTALAVLLGVSFVAGTLIFSASASEAVRQEAQHGLGHLDLAVQPTDSGSATDDPPNRERTLIDEALVHRLAELPNVKQATGSISGFTALADPQGGIVGDGWATEGRNYPADPDRRYDLRDGRPPEGPDEVALDEATANRAGYQVGDTVRLSTAGPVQEAEVSGVVEVTDGAATGGSLVLFDTATAQRLLAEPGRLDLVSVVATEGATPEQLRDAVLPLLPDGVTARTANELAEDDAAAEEAALNELSTVLLAFAGIALFTGVFVIANTFTMLTAQRTRELALLRAVGATRGQVTRVVLTEAALIGLMAGAAGVLAGFGIAAGLHWLLADIGGHYPEGPLVLTGGTVVTALATGIAASLVAAWLPARRAGRIPPMAALQEGHHPTAPRSLRLRATVGGLLAAAGIPSLAVGGVVGGSADSAVLLLGLGAALLLCAVTVLTPLLARPVVTATAALLRVRGASGHLAKRNALRNPRRTAATASSLMIGLALVTGLTVLTYSVQQGLDRLVADSIRADYVISQVAYGDLDPEVRTTVAALPGVGAISPLQPASADIGGDSVSVTGVDVTTIEELATLNFVSGSFDGLREEAEDSTGTGTGALVDSALAERHGWQPGDTVSADFGHGSFVELTIGGTYEGSLMFQGVLVDTTAIGPDSGESQDRQLLIGAAHDADQLRGEIEQALGNSPALLVQDPDDLTEEHAQLLTMVLTMVQGLLALAVLVAALGVTNTMALSVIERRREIGLLRAVGLDRVGVARMVRLESLLIALFGGVLGTGLGILLSATAGPLISGALPTYTLTLPWGQLGLILAMSVTIGGVAGLWPARSAAHLPLLSALRSE